MYCIVEDRTGEVRKKKTIENIDCIALDLVKTVKHVCELNIFDPHTATTRARLNKPVTTYCTITSGGFFTKSHSPIIYNKLPDLRGSTCSHNALKNMNYS